MKNRINIFIPPKCLFKYIFGAMLMYIVRRHIITYLFIFFICTYIGTIDAMKRAIFVCISTCIYVFRFTNKLQKKVSMICFQLLHTYIKYVIFDLVHDAVFMSPSLLHAFIHDSIIQ